MRYYVYSLIDPTAGNTPFYIGKGVDSRLQCHFKAAARLAPADETDVIGCDTRSVLDDAADDRTHARLARIAALTGQGFDHTHVARVVARRLDERTALAVEGFLIRSVYGLARLTNRVEGAHADRFRPVGRDGFLPGFDVLEAAADADLRAVEARFGRFYVYTLRDTRTGRPFYVGKGTGRRMFAHFRDAAGASPVDPAGHLPALRQLMREGCVPSDVCRVEARVADEQQAFALEALMLKFVHGLPGVDNRVAGHHGEMFRAKGDWAIRRGFDLPYVCDPGAASDRADKRDGMIGEGLAVPLLAVAAEFPDLRFDPPRVLDSADLGVEADVVPPAGGAGVRLKVFIRRRRLQVELRPRRKAHRDWVREHFTRLGAYPLRRRDDVFFPDAWRGPGNMTDDLAEVARRVRLLREIVDATDPKSLSAEARSLLPSRVTGSP